MVSFLPTLEKHQYLNSHVDWKPWALAMRALFYESGPGVYKIMEPVFEPTFDYFEIAEGAGVAAEREMKWDDYSDRMKEIHLALSMIMASACIKNIIPPTTPLGDDPVYLWALLEYHVAHQRGKFLRDKYKAEEGPSRPTVSHS